jgi:SAM-dependent methyltransferase
VGIRSVLYRCYWKAEEALLPGFCSTQQAYYRALRPVVLGKEWLDLGCGHSVFWPWMEREQTDVLTSAKSVFGIDLDWDGLKAHPGISNKAFASACELPFPDESFDVVSANMVVEHFPVPAAAVEEAFRVLRPGGSFIFHTPNVGGWPTSLAARTPERIKKLLFPLFDGRAQEDVFETHYRMNTPLAVRQLARDGGFEVQDLNMISTSATTALFGPIAWVELLYIRWLRHPARAGKRSNMIALLSKPDKRCPRAVNSASGSESEAET